MSAAPAGPCANDKENKELHRRNAPCELANWSAEDVLESEGRMRSCRPLNAMVREVRATELADRGARAFLGRPALRTVSSWRSFSGCRPYMTRPQWRCHRRSVFD